MKQVRSLSFFSCLEGGLEELENDSFDKPLLDGLRSPGNSMDIRAPVIVVH